MKTITEKVIVIQTVKTMNDGIHCAYACEYFAPDVHFSYCARNEDDYVKLKTDGKYFSRTDSCTKLFCGRSGTKAMKAISKIVTAIATVRIMDDGVHCNQVCPFMRQLPDLSEKTACCILTGAPMRLWRKDGNGLFRRLSSCIEAEARNENH